MSFMLLFYLFFVGIFLAILSLVPQEKDRDFFAVISTYYVFILVFVVPVCTIGTGTYNWLKHGDWLTISPEFLLSYLDEENGFRVHLLSENSFVGLQRISEWYMSQNLGWSCIVLGFLILWCGSLLQDNGSFSGQDKT